MSSVKNVIKDKYNMMLLKDYLREAIKEAGSPVKLLWESKTPPAVVPTPCRHQMTANGFSGSARDPTGFSRIVTKPGEVRGPAVSGQAAVRGSRGGEEESLEGESGTGSGLQGPAARGQLLPWPEAQRGRVAESVEGVEG